MAQRRIRGSLSCHQPVQRAYPCRISASKAGISTLLICLRTRTQLVYIQHPKEVDNIPRPWLSQEEYLTISQHYIFVIVGALSYTAEPIALLQ